MYLAFDTETTDLPRPHLDPSHPAQPHLLQFAGIVFDDDGNEIERLITLVRPGHDAVLMSQAYHTHGISLEQAFHLGCEPSEVFRWFTAKAQQVRWIVGHNVKFDLEIMKTLGARTIGKPWEPNCAAFCTMSQAMPIVNLPPTAKMVAAGRYHPKPPTLSECINHFFGEKLVGAHDAAEDVRACIRVFRYLMLEPAIA